jgi:copper chaperone NosL
MNRRDFLRLVPGGLLLPAGFAMVGTGCSHSALPEGIVEIKWDRDTCTRCSMVISDRRFATEVHGGSKGETFKFDDVGCAVFWLRDQKWSNEAATHIWVLDSSASGRWLEARKAYYTGGRHSPMGYDFAAVALPQPGALEFEDMRQHVLARGH